VAPGRAIKVAAKNAFGLKGTKTVKILAGPARGVTMALDFSGQTPMYLGMFEWELHRFLLESLRNARLVYDVGGYVGYDALLFAANSTAEVVTFEPDPAQVEVIRRNVALNPDLEGRITIDPNAITERSGDGGVTLDDVSARIGVPDFIKMDIDLAEADALRGGRELLSSRRPHLVVETHSLELEEECGALLVEYGYKPIIKHNRKIWREHRAGAPHNRWLLAAGESV
jgi:hypothetical protein